jgi:amidase
LLPLTDAVKARNRDKTNLNTTTLFMVPILIKTTQREGMPTTAGTLAQQYCRCLHHYPNKRQRRYHFGKTNLSEWANFLFFMGPNGYSAVGGQTLNPYGRKIFDTGGSSSGSGAQ